MRSILPVLSLLPLLTAVAAAQNLAPPSSPYEILDLAGSPIMSDPTEYSVDFTATTSTSTVTFAFRHDPGFFHLYHPSVTDATTADSTNLLVNSDFTEGGDTSPFDPDPVPEWTVLSQPTEFPQYFVYQSVGGGVIDGATQSYDGIAQSFATTVGDTYNVTFGLQEIQADMVGASIYQPVSTNGDTTDTKGNGIDLLVYAGAGAPDFSAVPAADAGSSATLGVIAFAMLAVPVLARSRRRKLLALASSR